MEVTIIDKGNIHFFKSLLIPEAVQMLIEGKPLFALGLIDNGVACGALAGGPYENVFTILSLFVAPDYRRKGGAALLLQTLEDLTLRIDELYEIRAAFSVISEEHRLIEGFLKSSGFTFERENESIKEIRLGALKDIPFFSVRSVETEVEKLSALPKSLLRELDRSMRAGDGAPLPVPLDHAEFEPDLSLCVLSGGHIDSFVLFDHSSCGLLTLAYAFSGTKRGTAVFSSMLKAAFHNAQEKYSDDTRIIIHTVTPLSEALVEKLAGGEQISRSAFLRIRD